MAARFRDVQARLRRRAVGVISTGQLVTEEFYALGKLVQLGLGTSQLRRQHDAVHVHGGRRLQALVRQRRPARRVRGPRAADVILLIGANIAENHPILCRRLQANPDTTLIVVDPRVTKTAMMADLHLPIRPRSDLALLNGLIHVVIEHDLVDRDYIDAPHDRLRRAARVGARVHAGARARRSPAWRRS